MPRYVCILICAVLILLPAVSNAEEPISVEPLISRDTRLMVFSPHPDDESLGAGGLIQRTLKAGGKVRVVFMTSGDGFKDGVRAEEGTSNPSHEAFRKYGEERRLSALRALAALGVKERGVIFLGFPDGGLTPIRLKYPADPQAYRCPYTSRNRPPAFERIFPDADYNRQDLTRQLMRVIEKFRPTVVATTPLWDHHPDHYATYHFVKDALGKLSGKYPDVKPKVLTFLIHYYDWPVDQSSTALSPPANFPRPEIKWISFPLKPEEVEAKRKAILLYDSQVEIMGKYLLSFVKPNELFVLEN